jgi:aminomethyltransferase
MTDEALRHSPLENVHRDLGAKLAPFGGWLMPIEYAGTLSEHRAVRERVGLFDLSHLGKLDVTGPAATETIRATFTNDPNQVAVGRAQYHHFLDPGTGGVLEDLFAYRLGDDRWFLVPNASNKEHVVSTLRDTDAEVLDHDDWCFLGVQGPRSPEVIQRLWPDAASMPFRGCAVVDHAGVDVVLARTGYTGERGFELFAPGDIARNLWGAVVAAGRDDGLEPCGLGARDVLRLEMGYPLYGQDLDATHTTLEAGLGWAVSFDKGPFRGREPLERQRADGLPSRLHGLATSDRRSIPRAHQPVFRGAEPVGEVTSGTFSPTRGTGIALAYLHPGDAFDVGDEVEIDIRGRRATAVVVETPFVDRSPR